MESSQGHALTTFSAPRTLVLMNSMGLYSAAGTCLSAAACTTVSMPSRARRSRFLSRTSPMKNLNCGKSCSGYSCCTSHCFSSSLLKMTIRSSPGSLRRFATKALPKLPVPPVIRTRCIRGDEKAPRLRGACVCGDRKLCVSRELSLWPPRCRR